MTCNLGLVVSKIVKSYDSEQIKNALRGEADNYDLFRAKLEEVINGYEA